MGIENFQILFDNPSGTYFPGQTLSGKAEFTLNSKKTIRGISIEFKGEAKVHWTESESHKDSNGRSSTVMKSFDGSENYFSMKYYVLGGQSHNSIELPVGEHVFPFTTTLPSILPSSFEGDYGYIRYTVKATLDRPWKFDQTIKAAFTVISHLDCNANPQVREPATLTMEKFLCCLCCLDGPLTGVLKLPCTGFVSGQVIPYILEIDNATNVGIGYIEIKLKQNVIFHSDTPRSKTKQSSAVVSKFSVPSNSGTSDVTVEANSSKTFSETFTVPALPPSNLQHCRIIDLEYKLKIEVTVLGFHKDMYGKIPVVIGTIPLTNMIPMPRTVPATTPEQISFASETECSARQPLLGWVPGATTSTPIAPVDPHLLPPPTYEECQFGTKSILDASDSEFTKLNNDRCYAPAYPVYNFNAVPSTQPAVGPAPPISNVLPYPPVSNVMPVSSASNVVAPAPVAEDPSMRAAPPISNVLPYPPVSNVMPVSSASNVAAPAPVAEDPLKGAAPPPTEGTLMMPVPPISNVMPYPPANEDNFNMARAHPTHGTFMMPVPPIPNVMPYPPATESTSNMAPVHPTEAIFIRPVPPYPPATEGPYMKPVPVHGPVSPNSNVTPSAPPPQNK